MTARKRKMPEPIDRVDATRSVTYDPQKHDWAIGRRNDALCLALIDLKTHEALLVIDAADFESLMHFYIDKVYDVSEFDMSKPEGATEH